MHRNHLTNTLTYENYCLKAKLQELLEKIAHLQAQLLTYRDGTQSRGDELPTPTEQPIQLQEELNKKDIEIEYLKEQIATLSQKSEDVTPDEKIDISAELTQQIIQLQGEIALKNKSIHDMILFVEENKKELQQISTEIEDTKRILSLREAENEHLKTIIAGKDAEIAHLKMTCPQP